MRMGPVGWPRMTIDDEHDRRHRIQRQDAGRDRADSNNVKVSRESRKLTTSSHPRHSIHEANCASQALDPLESPRKLFTASDEHTAESRQATLVDILQLRKLQVDLTEAVTLSRRQNGLRVTLLRLSRCL